MRLATVLAALAAAVALLATAVSAQPSDFSTVCDVALQRYGIADPRRANVKVIKNNGNNQLQVFWTTTPRGLYTGWVDPTANISTINAVRVVSNLTNMNDYRVGVAGTTSRLMVVVMNVAQVGLLYRVSDDAGDTWYSYSLDGVKVTGTGGDGPVSPLVSSVQQRSFDLTYTGSQFVLATYDPGSVSSPMVFYLNSSTRWNNYGYNWAAGTYNGVAVDANGSPYDYSGSAVAPSTITSATTPSIVVASDGFTSLIAYQLASGVVEFQGNTATGIAVPFSRRSNSSVVVVRSSMRLASAGLRNYFMLVSAYQSSDCCPNAQALVSEMSVDGGRTWGQARIIKGGVGVQSGNVPFFDVVYTNQWIVAFSDNTPGLTAAASTNVLISTSTTGWVWTTPEVLLDAAGSNAQSLDLYAVGTNSYLLGYQLMGGIGILQCPVSNQRNGVYGSRLSSGAVVVSKASVGVSVVAAVAAAWAMW